VIIYWSLGSSLPETITFHSLWGLIATAASCLAWLLFGITQLRIEGNRVFGAEAVVVNLLGIIVYTLCTIIKMAGDANVRIKSISKSFPKSHFLNQHLESHLHKNRFLYLFTLQQLFYIPCAL
jgi:hypothetical protein